MKRPANTIDLGRISYSDAVLFQKTILEEVAGGSRTHTLLLVEHPPVLTLGANFHQENLLLPREEYAKRGIEIHETERGGDITYHGPGQLVLYPIFNLNDFGRDLHLWLRQLEEVVILMLARFGLEGRRFPPNTGVWIDERKVAAIGIKVRRWVSMHGIAINCDNDLSPFGLITPCGIKEYGVTSLSSELGKPVGIDALKPIALQAFAELFSLKWDG